VRPDTLDAARSGVRPRLGLIPAGSRGFVPTCRHSHCLHPGAVRTLVLLDSIWWCLHTRHARRVGHGCRRGRQCGQPERHQGHQGPGAPCKHPLISTACTSAGWGCMHSFRQDRRVSLSLHTGGLELSLQSSILGWYAGVSSDRCKYRMRGIAAHCDRHHTCWCKQRKMLSGRTAAVLACSSAALVCRRQAPSSHPQQQSSARCGSRRKSASCWHPGCQVRSAPYPTARQSAFRLGRLDVPIARGASAGAQANLSSGAALALLPCQCAT
jgi:hypothetical protein